MKIGFNFAWCRDTRLGCNEMLFKRNKIFFTTQKVAFIKKLFYLKLNYLKAFMCGITGFIDFKQIQRI